MDDHEMKNCRKCGDLYDVADIVGFTVHQQGHCVAKQRDELRKKLADEVTAHARTCVKLHAAQGALRRLSSPSWCPQAAEAVRMNDDAEEAEEAAVGVVAEMSAIAREALGDDYSSNRNDPGSKETK